MSAGGAGNRGKPANPFQNFFVPYLEQARQIWPWLVGAAIIGGIITALIAGFTALGCRKKKKRTSEETQPLLMESEDYQRATYQSHL